MKSEPLLRISDKTRTATKANGLRIPVVDAVNAFLVKPNEDDKRNGIPNDPARCMFCLACMRQYNSELVWVTRTRAYVEQYTPAGTSQLIRCVLSKGVRKLMNAFDLGEEVPKYAITFDPPAPYQRLDAILVRNAKSNQKLAAKRKIASIERKAAALRNGKQVKAPAFVPVPEYLLPKLPKPAPKPRKKQDPLSGAMERPSNRGGRFYQVH